MSNSLIAWAAAALVAAPVWVGAQSASDEIARYREMLAEGNPSELYEAAGEELWVKPSGPLQATLEKCDLGLGPGVVDGAKSVAVGVAAWESIRTGQAVKVFNDF